MSPNSSEQGGACVRPLPASTPPPGLRPRRPRLRVTHTYTPICMHDYISVLLYMFLVHYTQKHLSTSFHGVLFHDSLNVEHRCTVAKLL